jgi:hypothetical protein
MRALYLATVLGLLVSAGCKKAGNTPAEDPGPGMAMDTGTMRGMSGMDASGMMAAMPAHMDSMMRMTPDQMTRKMAGHQRMMSQMMDQMGGEMRQMKMAETREWRALTDSVRQDLAELPGLTGQELSARMRAHAGRVQRLMAAHQGMMKGMR